MRFAELDAVTLDAHGTLVELADPVPDLDRGLRERGIERSGREIARAFAAEVDYYREIGLHEMVMVTYAIARMTADGARFVIENEIWSAAGERVATIRSTGGWLDLRARKLISPPPHLLSIFQKVPRTPDFVEWV